MSTTLPGTIQCNFTATNDSELQAGVQNLGPGQILCVFPGTYHVSFDFQGDPNGVAIPSGEPRNPVTITGYDPTTGTFPDAANRPRIQPQIATPLTRVLLLQDAHDIVIDSLFLDGSSGEVDPTGMPQKTANDIVKLTGRENPPGHPISGCTDIIITNCELAWALNNGVLTTELCLYNQFLNLGVHDNGDPTAPLPHGHGFYINTSYNVVDHCEISHNAGNGIQCYTEDTDIYATHNIIRDCIIHDNGDSGIIVIASPSPTPPTAENVANNVIYNNVVYGNSAGGIWIGGTGPSGTPGAATDVEVYNNTVFHNGESDPVHGIYVDPNSTNIDVQNNISSQNVGGEYSGNVDQSKNWPEGSAPPFVDITNPGAPDLHLTSHTSPQGGHLGNVTSDADGGCRRSGTYDMGAYEFGSTPGCVTWL